MVTLAIEKGGAAPAVGRGVTPVSEFTLRVIGAALQILATLVVVRALPPVTAGIYFKGFIIAYGLAALLRGKYELFIFEFFVSERQSAFEVPARVLVRAMGIRVLARSALACAVLLVVTTDLDVIEPHFRPYLQTYLPFVLAVPFATLGLFLSSTLRAVNRTLGSILVANYGMNLAIIAAAAVAPPGMALLILSWAFFVGSLLMAAMGVLITRYIFQAPSAAAKLQDGPFPWKEIYGSAARNGLTGVALAVLQWGPLWVLALISSELQIAEYSVLTRTAQVVDLLIPAVILVPQSVRFQSRLCQAMRTQRGKLAVDLAVSMATTSAYVIAIAILAPWLADLFGSPYSELTALFALLLAMQWVNGAGRPAIRHLAADWNLGRIRRVLFISASAAMLLTLVGVNDYGALAVAAAMLVGALIENAQALGSALRDAGGATTP